jgi:hypothetical protein
LTVLEAILGHAMRLPKERLLESHLADEGNEFLNTII